MKMLKEGYEMENLAAPLEERPLNRRNLKSYRRRPVRLHLKVGIKHETGPPTHAQDGQMGQT